MGNAPPKYCWLYVVVYLLKILNPVFSQSEIENPKQTATAVAIQALTEEKKIAQTVKIKNNNVHKNLLFILIKFKI